MMQEERLRGVIQLLQANPSNYRAFGPYWWSIKRILKEHYNQDVLYALGPQDEPETRAILAKLWPAEESRWEAALNHYVEKTVHGEAQDRYSALPDGSPYEVHDQDFGPAE